MSLWGLCCISGFVLLFVLCFCALLRFSLPGDAFPPRRSFPSGLLRILRFRDVHVFLDFIILEMIGLWFVTVFDLSNT